MFPILAQLSPIPRQYVSCWYESKVRVAKFCNVSRYCTLNNFKNWKPTKNSPKAYPCGLGQNNQESGWLFAPGAFFDSFAPSNASQSTRSTRDQNQLDQCAMRRESFDMVVIANWLKRRFDNEKPWLSNNSWRHCRIFPSQLWHFWWRCQLNIVSVNESNSAIEELFAGSAILCPIFSFDQRPTEH